MNPLNWLRHFAKALRQIGFVEGQNAVIAFRWAEGHYERLPALASDLVDLRPTAKVSIEWVDYVDQKVHLNKPSTKATSEWQMAA